MSAVFDQQFKDVDVAVNRDLTLDNIIICFRKDGVRVLYHSTLFTEYNNQPMPVIAWCEHRGIDINSAEFIAISKEYLERKKKRKQMN